MTLEAGRLITIKIDTSAAEKAVADLLLQLAKAQAAFDDLSVEFEEEEHERTEQRIVRDPSAGNGAGGYVVETIKVVGKRPAAPGEIRAYELANTVC